MQSRLEQDVIFTAESFTNNFADKGKLDFSIESLCCVDDILDELCDFELDEDNLDSVSSMAGCYIFEVARRNYGGKYYWITERKQPVLVTGEPNFSISILAFDKVKGRILNGQEDNIPYYFEGYIQAVQKGKETGYCATIV
ncbi:hypothetical protein SAMN04488542_101292 [Fontibacillus panacisegetis]|uniref:Uncharacterized protein n=1 Tax=Fontibacillus panacisegetis TaxID=670482 RepID=A0A1G7EQJ0_9BACL|nr:hypothetical protein [Fontibacillus panacisegetis]SDE65716.1 hypothetical protein SAMN04488542_101292 [Fontibacillus panacisegetis]